MDKSLIDNWNSLVSPTDTVYHLGDFSFASKEDTEAIVKSLNGNKILIRGNHDRFTSTKMRAFGFADVYQSLQIDFFGQKVNLSHYPYYAAGAISEGKQNFYLENDGNWLLHGHVHNSYKRKDKMINVGVDVWDFVPVSEGRIKLIMEGITFEKE